AGGPGDGVRDPQQRRRCRAVVRAERGAGGVELKRLPLLLPHPYFSAVVREGDLVHELADEVKAATVVALQAFAGKRIGDAGGVVAGAGVAHGDEHAARGVAAYDAAHGLAAI